MTPAEVGDSVANFIHKFKIPAVQPEPMPVARRRRPQEFTTMQEILNSGIGKRSQTAGGEFPQFESRLLNNLKEIILNNARSKLQNPYTAASADHRRWVQRSNLHNLHLLI